MKTFCRLAACALMTCMVATLALAQAPATTLSNLAEGVGSINAGSGNWANFSEIVLIPGSAIFGVKGSSTVLTLAFTAGSTVDIGNMVLYKSARSGNTNLGTKKVLLGGVSNPSINLTKTSVCPVQPVSSTNPCLIKLDPVKLALSPLNDYWFVVYFANDSNNTTMLPGYSTEQGSLSGFFMTGDETRIKSKGALPTGNGNATPYFLVSLTNQ